MAQRVLVTGGTGFIGGNLVRQLVIQGDDVTILSRSKDKGVPSGLKYIQCNLKEEKPDVTNYDVIYHCASTVNEYNFLHSKPEDIETNCLGTYNLLEAIRHHNPWTRLVYISTFFVNGDPPSLPVNELTEPRPKGLYGITKLAAEQFCKSYHNIFDLNVVIARLTNVYGPNQPWANQRTAAFNWMIQSAVQDKTISLYDNGKIRRDYIYIDDAVRGIMAVGNDGRAGDLYLVGTGIGTSFLDMLHIIQEKADGGKIRVVHSPGFHKRVGIGDFWVDNTKVKSLGWRPLIDLETGIQNTVEYYNGLYSI